MKKNLPKISIITPSFNQARFIKKTINSVLSQNYPNLDYIIMDGGSTDGTTDILEEYRDMLRYFIRKDNGQTDAINQGIKKAAGEILGYLNSDDLLTPGTLHKVAEFFRTHPDYYWVTGKCYIADKNDRIIRFFVTSYKNNLLKYFRSNWLLAVANYISQPGTFWRKEVIGKIGLFDQSLYYAMDYDYWLRLSKIYRLGFIDDELAVFRIQPDSKSVKNSKDLLTEGWKVTKRYNGPLLSFLHRLHDRLITSIYQNYI